MDKGALLGIIGGSAVFVIVLLFVFYFHSDFDQQLINQVDSGVPAEKLNPQIDKETEKMEINARRFIESVVMDKKYWGNGELASSKDLNSYVISYESEMKMISIYDSARKKYAKREITKEKFLIEIKECKDFISYYN